MTERTARSGPAMCTAQLAESYDKSALKVALPLTIHQTLVGENGTWCGRTDCHERRLQPHGCRCAGSKSHTLKVMMTGPRSGDSRIPQVYGQQIRRAWCTLERDYQRRTTYRRRVGILIHMMPRRRTQHPPKRRQDQRVQAGLQESEGGESC